MFDFLYLIKYIIVQSNVFLTILKNTIKYKSKKYQCYYLINDKETLNNYYFI